MDGTGRYRRLFYDDNIMKYKLLGNSKTKIAAVGQGCMGIGGYLSKDSVEDKKQIDTLRMGIELGMTFIDTAEVYGEGHSEEIVGSAISGLRDKVFIATKVSPDHLSCDGLQKSAEASLRRLKTDHIDLFQVHWPNPNIPIEETMRAMERLITDGKIKHIGISNCSLSQTEKAGKSLNNSVISSLQSEYNLFDRSAEKSIMPYCEKKLITLIAYSPLNNGKIAGDDKKMVELRRLAEKYGKTTAQISLNWLVMHPAVVVIPKATNPDHLRENSSAVDFEISQEDFDSLSQVFTSEPKLVPVDRIRVSQDSQGDRKAYETIDEAKQNKLNFVPSPYDLAKDLSDGEFLKPVRVIKTKDVSGRFDYDLVEGRIRYWAWAIAFEGKKMIPVYVRDNH
ncbi:MAG: aldo/keto reductase [Syntrophales bacterium]